MANSVAPIPRMRTDAIAILSSVRIQSHFSGRIAISESNMPAQLGEDIICPPSGFHASQVLIDAVTGEVKSWYVKCPVNRLEPGIGAARSGNLSLKTTAAGLQNERRV